VVNTKWENRFESLQKGNVLVVCSSVLGQCSCSQAWGEGRWRSNWSRATNYNETTKFQVVL